MSKKQYTKPPLPLDEQAQLLLDRSLKGISKETVIKVEGEVIRRDEETDNIHSIFVDQWDWEKIITKEERTEETLRDLVNKVYSALRKTEKYMSIRYDYIKEILPDEIFFVTTEELANMFPDNTPEEREYYIAKAKGAVCVMKIGDVMENGEKHGNRAPDYDDWELNGDIIVYYPVLDIALELSSMGIRVDERLRIHGRNGDKIAGGPHGQHRQQHYESRNRQPPAHPRCHDQHAGCEACQRPELAAGAEHGIYALLCQAGGKDL